MNHKHHSCDCDHKSIKYCKTCNVAHCLDCNMEWHAKSTYTWYYPWTSTYQATPTVSPTTGVGGQYTNIDYTKPVNISTTNSCNHEN